MTLLAGFLEVLFRAIIFVGMAQSVGGVIFRGWVLPTIARSTLYRDALRRTAALAAIGAAMLAVCQLLELIITPWAMANDDGVWPLRAYLSTGIARGGLFRAALAMALATILFMLRAKPLSRGGWVAAGGMSLLLMVSSGRLTHGASRLTYALPLMTLTVIHQLAAAVWIGGTIHLTGVWRILRRSGEIDSLWPGVLARFSRIAAVSVTVLLTAGIALYWPYVGGLGPLIGTAYGTMLLTKILLTVALLGLGATNFFAIRQWKLYHAAGALLRRVPILVETEAAIGITVLMAAAAFTGQPPAVDVADRRASLQEIAYVFAPKEPQLRPAPWADLQATATSRFDLYTLPSHLEVVQSNFNHNWCGLFVIVIGLAALADQLIGGRALRHWPLLFLPFGLFILVIAEPTVWPMGPESFWKTLLSPEALTHRFGALLVIALGLFQWRVRATGDTSRWRLAFPVLCFIGGAMLLSHSHTVFAVKWAFLIQVSHNAIGVLAVLTGAASWLAMRLEGRERRIAGLVWPICLTLVGVVLLFYRETVFA